MTENEFSKKEIIFAEKLDITDKDFETYRKVLKYFYVLDAFCWCSDNNCSCSDELAEEMADYVIDNHDSNLSHWDNFEAAYDACAQN